MDSISTLIKELRPSQARRRGFESLHPLQPANLASNSWPSPPTSDRIGTNFVKKSACFGKKGG